MRAIVRSAPLSVAEYFPSRIELQDAMLIATGIRYFRHTERTFADVI